MTSRSLQLEIKINFFSVFLTVSLLHVLLMFFGTELIPALKLLTFERPRTNSPLNIREIRTVGSRDSKLRNMIVPKGEEVPAPSPAQRPSKKSLSFSDLSAANMPVKNIAKAVEPQAYQPRPGTRPEVLPERKKAINAISLRGKEIQKFVQAENAQQLSGDQRTPGISESDILVNLEVPEGVHPDELNKYELMFYSFQRRTAINYINSFYKNLDKFQRANPHKQFPMTDTKQVMTGRLTYDEKGNIKQIKMIRWSNEDSLQNFFVDVLKDMDTLHNPPHALWEKNGEFSIFFSLIVNG